MSEFSPNVSTEIINEHHFTPKLIGEIAAYVGFFEKGPINTPTFITTIDEFKLIFGRGIGLQTNDWYQVYNFLSYTSGIWVVRAGGLTQANSNTISDLIYFEDKNELETLATSYTLNDINFFAKTSGPWGNLLKVAIISKNEFDNNVTLLNDIKAKHVFKTFKEDHYGIIVFRNDRTLEGFHVTKANIPNISSKYVYLIASEEFNLYYDNNILELSNGISEYPTDTDFSECYNLLKEKDMYDIDIIIGNEKDNALAIDVANTRKDCIAFIGIPTIISKYLKVVDNEDKERVLYLENGQILAMHQHRLSRYFDEKSFSQLQDYINTIPESHFIHFTGNIKEQYDGFTNRTKLINVAGDVAGLKSQASLSKTWSVNAGLERGTILNSEGIYLNIKKDQRNKLYKKGLNYIENGVLMTQRTFYTKPSAFSKVHVRSIFNHIEKKAESILRKFIFEENKDALRRNIALEIKLLLKDMKSSNGIESGKVKVHKSNNNSSEIIIDVYIKPLYVTEYIQLRIKNVGSKTITNILSNTIG